MEGLEGQAASPSSPTNKELFYSWGAGNFIPKEISYYARVFTSQGDRMDKQRQMLQGQVAYWVSSSPRYLQDIAFYTPYCEANGLVAETTVKSKWGDLKVKKPTIPFAEQTAENLVGDIKWLQFMDTYKMPRLDLIKIAKDVIGGIPRIDARYIDLGDIQRFDRDMKIGSYKVALRLMPDLSDKEAIEIFGNATLSRAKILQEIEEYTDLA